SAPNVSRIQRQPAPSPSAPSSSGATGDPGYDETPHAPSFRVRVVAHASPRWRGARSNVEADRNNLALSQRRAQAVRTEVEKLLAARFPQGVSVAVDTVYDDDDDGTIGVSTEARGSRDTLREARGSRRDNAAGRRRVDVVIDANQRISGVA